MQAGFFLTAKLLFLFLLCPDGKEKLLFLIQSQETALLFLKLLKLSACLQDLRAKGFCLLLAGLPLLFGMGCLKPQMGKAFLFCLRSLGQVVQILLYAESFLDLRLLLCGNGYLLQAFAKTGSFRLTGFFLLLVFFQGFLCLCQLLLQSCLFHSKLLLLLVQLPDFL